MSAQQPAAAHVIIRVVDQSGAPIPQAGVKVIPIPDPQPARMQADDNGELELQLKPGGHAVFASQLGFKRAVQHIEVQPAESEQTISIVLRVGATSSPLVISEQEAAQQATELLLSAMPFRQDWWITQQELNAMPRTNFNLYNPHTGKREVWSGVRLVDLLTQAGIPLGTAWDDISLTITLVAAGSPVEKNSTGHTVLFSLAELQPSVNVAAVLVADSLDGHPIGSHNGPFMLIDTADRDRLRWIPKLHSLTLRD